MLSLVNKIPHGLSRNPFVYGPPLEATTLLTFENHGSWKQGHLHNSKLEQTQANKFHSVLKLQKLDIYVFTWCKAKTFQIQIDTINRLKVNMTPTKDNKEFQQRKTPQASGRLQHISHKNHTYWTLTTTIQN